MFCVSFLLNFKQKMKILNITTNKISLPLSVKDVDGTNVFVTLEHDEFIFTPTEEKTRSVNLHGFKKNIGVTFDEKPGHLEYFVTYTKSDLSVKEKEVVIESGVSTETTSLQDSINLDSILKNVEKEDEENLFDKSKESIGVNEEELYSDLNLDEIKKSVEEYATEEPKPKPKRSRSKKGPGRPKKRGPKPKKKSPGRPIGSKNKKK